MAHALEIVNGEASMAYNVGEGVPWHGLGTPVEGLGTADDMLRIAKADYEVELLPVFVADVNGGYQEVPERYATTRINHDGSRQAFEVVKKRYHVVQNSEVMERALNVVRASGGDHVVETVGVLKDGREFFATIDLGSLVIDPAGINDKIARYLLVHSSHDGTAPITFANTEIRAVCANTVKFGQDVARSMFKARHTPNLDERMQEAQKVLEISTAWADNFKAQAEELLAIPVTSGDIDTITNIIWDPRDADTDRKTRNRDARIDDVRARFRNSRNAGHAGNNGWALFNAFVEHYDHGGNGDAKRRAAASMSPTSTLTAQKQTTHKAILSLVG